MRQAALIVTKPGGLTTAEALAVGLPMIVINPIPGQESNNAQFLSCHAAALQATDAEDVARRAEWLLQRPEELERLRVNARRCGHPRAAFATARLLIELNRACRLPTPPTALASALR